MDGVVLLEQIPKHNPRPDFMIDGELAIVTHCNNQEYINKIVQMFGDSLIVVGGHSRLTCSNKVNGSIYRSISVRRLKPGEKLEIL